MKDKKILGSSKYSIIVLLGFFLFLCLSKTAFAATGSSSHIKNFLPNKHITSFIRNLQTFFDTDSGRELISRIPSLQRVRDFSPVSHISQEVMRPMLAKLPADACVLAVDADEFRTGLPLILKDEAWTHSIVEGVATAYTKAIPEALGLAQKRAGEIIGLTRSPYEAIVNSQRRIELRHFFIYGDAVRKDPIVDYAAADLPTSLTTKVGEVNGLEGIFSVSKSQKNFPKNDLYVYLFRSPDSSSGKITPSLLGRRNFMAFLNERNNFINPLPPAYSQLNSPLKSGTRASGTRVAVRFKKSITVKTGARIGIRPVTDEAIKTMFTLLDIRVVELLANGTYIVESMNGESAEKIRLELAKSRGVESATLANNK